MLDVGRNGTQTHNLKISIPLLMHTIHYSIVFSGHQSRYLQLHPMLFTDQTNRVLSISVRGDWSRSRSYGSAAYEFIIGGTPKQGNCTIEPQDGVALQTEFVIQCTGNKSGKGFEHMT